jgi:hypothetical protein
VPRDAFGPEHLPTPNNADITAVWLLSFVPSVL